LFSDFFLDDVTQETFTEDPSKSLFFVHLFEVILEIEGLRMILARKEGRKGRKESWKRVAGHCQLSCPS
jgi:hypothetical protein